jgi:CBS domain containing-hemolysin-like protein
MRLPESQEGKISTTLLLTWLALLAICVGINAFFVLAEYSLISVRHSRIQELVDDGDSRAALVLALQKNREHILNCTQGGITTMTGALTWFGQQFMDRAVDVLFGDTALSHWLVSVHIPLAAQTWAALVLAFIAITFIQLLFGEQVPKLISVHRAEPVVLALARPLTVYCKLAGPFVWLLGKSVRGTMRLFRIQRNAASHETVVSSDELEIILHQSELAGELDPRTTDMLEGVLDVHDDYLVEHAMIPLERVDGVAVDASLEQLMATFERTKRNKLVVYQGNLGNVVGVLHTKDMFDVLHSLTAPTNRLHRVGFNMRNKMRKPVRVHGKVKAGDLIDQMRRRRTHIAIVIDEQGKTVGLVTMEDLLERIVGDISDHHETPKPAREPDETSPSV